MNVWMMIVNTEEAAELEYSGPVQLRSDEPGRVPTEGV